MIIVHDIFVCKPGNASKLAKKFKEAMADNLELVNIMTDMTGQFNRVVMVSQYENLSEYEKSWEKYMKNDESMKKMEEKNKVLLMVIKPFRGYSPGPFFFGMTLSCK